MGTHIGLAVPVVVVGGQTDDCGVVAAFGAFGFALSVVGAPFGVVACCGVYGSAFGIVGVVTGAVVDGAVLGVVEGVVAGTVVVVVAGAVAVLAGAAIAALPSSATPSVAPQKAETIFMAISLYIPAE